MLDARYSILGTGCWILDTRCWIVDTRYWKPDRMLNEKGSMIINREP